MKPIYGERNVTGPPIMYNYEEKSSDGNRLLDGRAARGQEMVEPNRAVTVDR